MKLHACLLTFLLLFSLDIHAQSPNVDAILSEAPVVVTNKSRTLSGNMNNYESLGRYAWPDTLKNDGSYVIRDGVVNPEINDFDFPRLIRLRKELRMLCDAYISTAEEHYRERFVKQIDAWFINRKLRMEPNFDYAQLVPGTNQGKGQYYGIIEAYEFCDIISSIKEMDASRSLGKSRMKKLRRWFSDFATWYQKSGNQTSVERLNNNITIASDILLYDMLTFCDRKDEVRSIVDAFVEKRVNSQIKEDGTMPAELRRTKAFSYSIYNLQFFLDFAERLHRDGINLIEQSPRIVKAVEFLSQYIGHRESFHYEEIDDWNLQERNLLKVIRRIERLKK